METSNQPKYSEKKVDKKVEEKTINLDKDNYILYKEYYLRRVFLTENILHFTLGMYLMNPRTNPLNIVKMPMVLATILGVFWSLNGWHLPVALSVPIDMIGQIAIPLMLFSLGVRMTQVDLKNWKINL